MPENLKEKLALLPFELVFGEVTGTDEIEIEGFRRNVYLFRSKYILGAALFTGDILINERLMEDEMEEGLKNVFLHEEGHFRQGFLKDLTGYSQILLSPPGLVIGLLIAVLLTGDLTADFSSIGNPGIWLIFLTTLFSISAIISYLGELDAQFFVLDEIGIHEFKKGEKQIEHVWPIKAYKKIFAYPSHPPNWLTIALYRKLNGFQK